MKMLTIRRTIVPILFLCFVFIVSRGNEPIKNPYPSEEFQSFGVVSGRVLGEIGEPLPGASIVIRELVIGTSTSLEGLFSLSRVPYGTHEIEVSYIGFEPYRTTIEVNSSSLSLGDIILNPSVNALGEVIITGSLEGQQRAFNQQKNADNIKTIVSADLISRFPDINVGEAMQRVPGVNIQRDNGEGSIVTIRGTPPNFTTVSINGEQIPTTVENGGRTESLDLISADQLASMEVSKAITPDMDGDAVGGAINLITPTASSSKGRVKGSIGGGYTNLFDEYSQIYKLRFDKRFADDKFGVLVGGSYYNTFNGEERFEATYRTRQIGADDDPNAFEASVLDDYRLRPLLNERTRIGLNATFDYRFSETSKVILKASYNQMDDESLRRRIRFRPRDNYNDPQNPNVAGPDSDVRVRRDINDRLISRENINISFEGYHNLGDFANLDYGITYTRNERTLTSDRFVFRARDLTLVQERDGDFTLFSSPDFDFEDYSAYDFNSFQQDTPILTRGDNTIARLNLAIPLNISKYAGELKFGGKYRDLDNIRRRNTTEFSNFDGPYTLDQVLDGNSGTIFDGRYEMGQFPNPNSAREHFNRFSSAYTLDEDASIINSETPFFDAGEDVYAAYVQGKIQLNKLRVLAGVRYEKTDVLYDAQEVLIEPPVDDDTPAQATQVNPVSGDNSFDFVLPMLHLKYDLSERTNIRFAYTQSYARPTLEDLVPSQNINFADQVISTGNPNLQPADAINLDLTVEHYLKGAGIISGGLFYKDITNYIFDQISNTTFNEDDFILFEPVNGDDATLLGVELNFVRKLDFLPGKLSGLSVFANYTYVDSESSFSSLNEDTGEIETRTDVPFIGQADHTWNAALAYDLGGFSARASLNYNGRSTTSFSTDETFDFFLEERYQLDVNASQKITKNLTAFVEFVNLTNEPVIEFQTVREQVVNYEIYDWSARFGLNFQF